MTALLFYYFIFVFGAIMFSMVLFKFLYWAMGKFAHLIDMLTNK